MTFADSAATSAESTGANTNQDGELMPEKVPVLDGVIGQLEIHRSGAIKMRLGNGIVYDVCVYKPLVFARRVEYILSNRLQRRFNHHFFNMLSMSTLRTKKSTFSAKLIDVSSSPLMLTPFSTH